MLSIDYFRDKLVDLSLQFGIQFDLSRVQVSFSETELGFLDVKYVADHSEEFDTRVDCLYYLQRFEITDHVRCFLKAQELRERVFYSNPVFYPQTSSKFMYFTFGNTIVLSWGTILTRPEFHNENHIFPLGFKCLRHECDEFSGQIIDCFCEIDGIYVENGEELFISDLPEEKQLFKMSTIEDLLPFFRITVNWETNGAPLIKVYEGRTPHQAWQGVLLETLKDFHSDRILQVNSESCLRSKLIDSRRTYFRALKQAQSQGRKNAVKPRLAISTQNIFEDWILQLVEGMDKSLDCCKYTFLEERGVQLDPSNLIQKLRRLDSISKKRRGSIEDEETVESTESEIHFQSIRSSISKDIKKVKEEINCLLDNFMKNENMVILQDRKITFQPSLKFGESCSTSPSPCSEYSNLDGKTFGQLLEIRMFFKTLKKLGFSIATIPSVDDFLVAYKLHTPIMQSISNLLRDQGNVNFFEAGTIITRSEIKNFWENLIIVFTQVLYSEFERSIGLDLVLPQIGELRLNVNSLTWKEILRTMLFAKLCKELKFSEQETASLLKGRGFVTSPDTIDKKCLKLIRRRLIYNYCVREEFQEALYGFETGLVVKLRIPERSSVPAKWLWIKVLAHLKKFENPTSWEVLDITRIVTFFLTFDDSDGKFGILRDSIITILNQSQSSNANELCASIFSAVETCVAALDSDTRKEVNSILSSNEVSLKLDSSVLDVSGYRQIDQTKDFLGRKDWSCFDLNVSSLSPYLQRCFHVLVAIIDHPLSDVLLSSNEMKGFLSFTSTLSFDDIQSKLLQNSYEDKIFPFYYDMCLIFESLLAFHSENSACRSNLLKLQLIFERLFFEMVLFSEFPLPYSFSCQLCRSYESPDPNTFATCDRCDGCYHLNCLESPYCLSIPPRGDWYCPFCVEQRGVASAHPYRLAKVLHTVSSTVGEVVGIEQIDGNILFIVDFKTFREMWTSTKIRENLECELETFGIMDFDDYDKACAYSQAYQGSGKPKVSQIPAVFNPLFTVQSLSIIDSAYYKVYSQLLLERNFSSEEWIEIFMVLIDLFFSVFACPQLAPSNDDVDKDKFLDQINSLFEENISELNESTFALDKDETESRRIDLDSETRGREEALCFVAATQKYLMEVGHAKDPNVVNFDDMVVQSMNSILKDDELYSIEKWLEGWETEINFHRDMDSPHVFCGICKRSELDLCCPMVLVDPLSVWVERFGNQVYSIGKITAEMHRELTHFTFLDLSNNDLLNSSNFLVAHTYCAELISLRRASSVIARKATDRQLLAEKLSKIDSAVMAPVGIDRDGCLYWIFEPPYEIYVGRPNTSQPLADKDNADYVWKVFRSAEEIRSLYNWLSDNIYEENMLKKVIRILHSYIFSEEFLSKDGGFIKLNSFPVVSSKNYSKSFSIHDDVYVKHNESLWLGKIEEIKQYNELKLYLVRYENWDSNYTGWYSSEVLWPTTTSFEDDGLTLDGSTFSAKLKERSVFQSVYNYPPCIETLQAVKFIGKDFRNHDFPLPFTMAQLSSPLALIKTALLTIFAALPLGCVDTSEDRWGDEFANAWVECVNLATDAFALMQCQLMLEFGIRTAWLKPTGLKFFSCLPSRSYAFRNASFGAVAIRLWTLDMTIKFEKYEKRS